MDLRPCPECGAALLTYSIHGRVQCSNVRCNFSVSAGDVDRAVALANSLPRPGDIRPRPAISNDFAVLQNPNGEGEHWYENDEGTDSDIWLDIFDDDSPSERSDELSAACHKALSDPRVVEDEMDPEEVMEEMGWRLVACSLVDNAALERR